jgi:hypothetical protein
MSNPLWDANQFAFTIKSWGLTKAQTKVILRMMDDIYMDGWGDGVAHRTNLTPNEHRERLTNDIQNSWTRLIVEELTNE